MGFRNGAICRVWQVDAKSPSCTTLRISISRKNKDTGEYEDDFSGFVSAIGSMCATKALKLKERDLIKLGDTDVSSRYDKESKKNWTNFKIFDFEKYEFAGGERSAKPTNPTTKKPDIDEEEPSEGLPF